MRLFLFFLLFAFGFGNSCPKYNRVKQFGGWKDLDLDGQNTRTEVLIEESLAPVKFKDANETKILSGKWHCPYSNKNYTAPESLDIDHLVPLKEVYESGAWNWTQERRVKYANFLERKNHLIAVYYKENRSKGDQDPGEWLPSNEAYHKQYVRDWVDVKARWGLTVDSDEVVEIRKVLGTKSAKTWLKNVKMAPETDCED